MIGNTYKITMLEGNKAMIVNAYNEKHAGSLANLVCREEGMIWDEREHTTLEVLETGIEIDIPQVTKIIQ